MLIPRELSRSGPTEIARVRGALLLLFLLAPLLARAQAPPPTNAPAGVSYPHFQDTPQGKVQDALFTGREAKSLPGGLVLVRDSRLNVLRDGQPDQVRVIALAPECLVDFRSGQQSLSDPGPLQIFTPGTNLFVQGVGFSYADSNQVLVISNQVETRVAESLLRSGIFPAPKTGAAADGGQVLQIFSDHGEFVYRSNLVNYTGRVRAADPQFQMLAPFLSVQFTGNLAVETILAWEGVTITLTNKGTATGATGSYFATNGAELLVLDGDAQWHHGLQEAKAAKFTYDPDRHFLSGYDHVFARWPNSAATSSAPVTFRELFADDATLQMSTNGELVDALNAEGNVILVNQADHSRANANRAVYDRTHDLFELTGDADWRNDEMEVQGDRLTLASSNKVFHAQNNAQFKVHVAGQPTNRWLHISSDDLVYQPVDARTNLATFRGRVQAQLLADGQLLDTLTCQLLVFYLDSSNQVETVVARGTVRGETAPDAAGVKKTISCGALTARRSPATGLWRSVLAEENVVMAMTRSGPAAATNRLAAATVNASFSSVTNQIEKAVAEGGVVFDQRKGGKSVHATGDHAVYDLSPVEQIVLTGHPEGWTEKAALTGADRLVWDAQSGGLIAAGFFHIIPVSDLATSGAAPPPPSP